MIWECLFVPRIIHITRMSRWRTFGDYSHEAGSPCDATTEECCARLIEIDHVGLASQIASVIPLSVCRDSRNFSLARGYTAWHFRPHPVHNLQMIMWNPDIDFISIQGCRTCFVNPLQLALFYPEQVAKIRNLVLYTEKGLQLCFDRLAKHGDTVGMHQYLSPMSRIDVIWLLTLYFRHLKSICFVLEPPPQWKASTDTNALGNSSDYDRSNLFKRRLRLGEVDPGNINTNTSPSQPSIRFATNERCMLRGNYKRLAIKSRGRSLFKAISSYWGENASSGDGELRI
jgi:hypothetical protein